MFTTRCKEFCVIDRAEVLVGPKGGGCAPVLSAPLISHKATDLSFLHHFVDVSVSLCQIFRFCSNPRKNLQIRNRMIL